MINFYIIPSCIQLSRPDQILQAKGVYYFSVDIKTEVIGKFGKKEDEEQISRIKWQMTKVKKGQILKILVSE